MLLIALPYVSSHSSCSDIPATTLSLSPTAGIRLAELSLFPAPVITQARQLVNTINTRQAQRKQPSMEARKEKLVRTLATTLMQVATNSKLDLPALRYMYSKAIGLATRRLCLVYYNVGGMAS